MDPGESQQRLSAQVSGRVQGVGFRYFVAHTAAQLGLAGYVRNSLGGRHVEVVAEGERQALDRLLAALRRGPSMAHVEHVSQHWESATGEFTTFGIRP